tara:strand:+ start:64 stop:375 length:312 start_codon:yes stop_codon:yes gene_type:complete
MDQIVSFLKTKEDILLVLTAYSVIQILALDLGINVPQHQKDLLIKNKIFHPILLYATAFTTTNNHRLSLITTCIYFIISFYFISDDENQENTISFRSLRRRNF